MDIYEKVKKIYKRRKLLAALMIAAGCACAILTVIFIFVDTGGKIAIWNQYHYWAVGLTAVLVTAGAIVMVSSLSALKDIEKTADRLNPDEREQAILEKAKVTTFKIYNYIIYPVIFIAASVLLMLEIINYIAWILIVVNFLAILITSAIVRAKEYKKYGE